MAEEDDADVSEDPKKKKKKKEEGSGGGPPGWMTTFSDLMSLLLTFFVLLVSMSHFDPAQMDRVLGSLSRAFSQEKKPLVPTGSSFFKNRTVDEAVVQLLRQLFDVNENVVIQEGQYIEIRIPAGAIFYKDLARMKLRQPLLEKMVDGIKKLPSEEQDFEIQLVAIVDTNKVGHYQIEDSPLLSAVEEESFQQGLSVENIDLLAEQLGLDTSAAQKAPDAKQKKNPAAFVPLSVLRVAALTEYFKNMSLDERRFPSFVKKGEEEDLTDDIIFRIRVRWSVDQDRNPFKMTAAAS